MFSLSIFRSVFEWEAGGVARGGERAGKTAEDQGLVEETRLLLLFVCLVVELSLFLESYLFIE